MSFGLTDENQFIEIKNSLIHYYTAQQTSQSARLIGFLVALFTLLQTVQYSKLYPLNGLFPNTIITFPCLAWFTELLKLLLLLLGILFLMVFIVRTVFRFSIYADLSGMMMEINLNDSKAEEPPISHSAAHNKLVSKVAAKKVYWIFKLGWFIPGFDELKKGWISSLLVGGILTIIIFALLW